MRWKVGGCGKEIKRLTRSMRPAFSSLMRPLAMRPSALSTKGGGDGGGGGGGGIGAGKRPSRKLGSLSGGESLSSSPGSRPKSFFPNRLVGDGPFARSSDGGALPAARGALQNPACWWCGAKPPSIVYRRRHHTLARGSPPTRMTRERRARGSGALPTLSISICFTCL